MFGFGDKFVKKRIEKIEKMMELAEKGKSNAVL